MEKAKIWPPPRPNTVSDSHTNRHGWLRCGPLHLCTRSSRSAQAYRFCACVTLRTKNVLVFLGGSCNSLQPRALGGFWRKIRQSVNLKAGDEAPLSIDRFYFGFVSTWRSHDSDTWVESWWNPLCQTLHPCHFSCSREFLVQGHSDSKFKSNLFVSVACIVRLRIGSSAARYSMYDFLSVVYCHLRLCSSVVAPAIAVSAEVKVLALGLVDSTASSTTRVAYFSCTDIMESTILTPWIA